MKNMMVMLWFLVVFVVTKPCAPSLLLVGTGNVSTSTVQGLLEQNKSRKAQKRFIYIYIKRYGGSLCYNRLQMSMLTSSRAMNRIKHNKYHVTWWKSSTVNVFNLQQEDHWITSLIQWISGRMKLPSFVVNVFIIYFEKHPRSAAFLSFVFNLWNVLFLLHSFCLIYFITDDYNFNCCVVI